MINKSLQLENENIGGEEGGEEDVIASHLAKDAALQACIDFLISGIRNKISAATKQNHSAGFGFGLGVELGPRLASSSSVLDGDPCKCVITKARCHRRRCSRDPAPVTLFELLCSERCDVLR